MSIFRDIATAVSLLTVIPARGHAPSPQVAAWFPWVGWVLGVPAVVLAYAFGYFRPGMSSVFLTPALVLGLWLAMTRGLHWDGLLDVWDALGPLDPQERVRVLRDSSVGAFATMAAVTAGLTFFAAGAGLAYASALWPWLVAPVLGRLCAAVAAWTVPSMRAEGLGWSAAGRPSAGAVIVAVSGAAPLVLLPSVVGLRSFAVGSPALLALVEGLSARPAAFVASLVAGLAVGVLAPRILARSFGGVNGDVFGATVVLTEIAVLVAAALA